MNYLQYLIALNNVFKVYKNACYFKNLEIKIEKYNNPTLKFVKMITRILDNSNMEYHCHCNPHLFQI